MSIILPKTTESGKPRISYSQYNLWNDTEAFQKILVDGKYISTPGNEGYILRYFLNYDFPASAADCFGLFGQKVEQAIEFQDYREFSPSEMATLQKVQFYPIFQREIAVDFGEFELTGIIDNCNEKQTVFQDFKTASEKSAQKYYKEEYEQLIVYAMDKYFKDGTLPVYTQVAIIERHGTPYKMGGCDNLQVGSNIWYVEKNITEEQIKKVEQKIRTTVEQISECYKVFLELNK